MTPLTATLGITLEPNRSVTISAFYDAMFNSPGTLPDRVVDVDPGSATADLTIDLVGGLGGGRARPPSPTNVHVLETGRRRVVIDAGCEDAADELSEKLSDLRGGIR